MSRDSTVLGGWGGSRRWERHASAFRGVHWQVWQRCWDTRTASGHSRDYCIGLLTCFQRLAAKSVEPLAAVTAPERTAAQHQSLLHFVAQAPWSDQAMLRRVREEHVLPSIIREEPIQAWIIDDTGFPKKRAAIRSAWHGQYCGPVGQAGQLPGCSEPLGGDPSGKSAPLLTGCIYPRSGPTMRTAGRSPVCRMTFASRPSLRSHCSSCARPWRMACRRAWR